MFSIHITPEEFENATITGHFGFVIEENSVREITLKRFPSTLRRKAAFSNSSGLKSVFVKLRSRDGLVWTVGVTVEIKLRFQIPTA